MRHSYTAFVCFALIAATAAQLRAQPAPVAHWPLAGDARDATGRGHNGIAHNITWNADGSAEFNGRDGFVEIPSHPDLVLGKSSFTFTAWVHTEKDLDDALGDIASKFNPTTRKGFTLSIMNYPGVTAGQPNWRNLAFGIDDAKITQPWTDCGRPGNCKMLWAFCVWRDDLYAATFELDADQAGHVYRYAGGIRWEDCGSPDKANAVTTLAVFEDQLYAGTACYNSVGSSLPASPNKNAGGKVYRYEGATKWTCRGQLTNPSTGTADTVHSLAVYRGKLYASSMYTAGKGLYEYQGGTNWRCMGNPGCRVDILGVYNGDLYTTSYDPPGQVARWNPARGWQDLGAPPETTQTYGFMPYEGRLMLATWPKATVYCLDKGDRWTYQGRLGEENETMAMVVYNGKLYAGSLPLAKVYRYDGGTTWAETGRLDSTPDMLYRRVWSMAVFKGKLFAGTMPSGHAWSFEAGRNATCDHEFSTGWHHVAAVRDDNRLRLYVDGSLVSRSEPFKPDDFDLSDGSPLRIGIGSHDYFRGRLADVRLYRGVLPDAAVLALSSARGAEPSWIKVTDHAAWSPRDSGGEVVFKDRMWLLGGWNAMEGPGPRDIWNSRDGLQWTRVMAEAPWVHGDLPVSLVFKDRMWMMAGWHGGRSKDASASHEVWSSADGAEWQCVTKAAAWKPRLGAAGAVFEDKMWLLGGVERYFDGDKYLLNDVWCSADGRDWTQVAEHAPWSPRAYHAALVFDGKLWIIGGGNYWPLPSAGNDVWSSTDGRLWTRVTEHAPWPGRIWFSSVVYRDRMWILGGWSGNPSKNWNDVWCSRDGKAWHEVKTSTIWSPRHEMSAYVFDDSLWIVGGNAWPLLNDVWRMRLPDTQAASRPSE